MMEKDYERNRRVWNAVSDDYQARHDAQLREHSDAWGVWSFPEDDLGLLGDVSGLDVLEYGCGGAQWSIALAKKGARVTGLDNSERQLEHARASVQAAGVAVTLVHSPAERTPFSDAVFDVVFCDHGAMTYAAPEITIPEVRRILRAGGIFAFSLAHPLHAVCWDETSDGLSRSLQRSYFDLERDEIPNETVSFPRPVSTYVNLLIGHGFQLEKLLEPRPHTDATTTYDDFAPLAWARDFPAELMIRARKV